MLKVKIIRPFAAFTLVVLFLNITNIAFIGVDATIDVNRFIELKKWGAHSEDVTSIAWSPDGTKIASASWDNTVKIWNYTTGQLEATLIGHNYYVWCVVWAPNGTKLASSSDDKTIRIWDYPSGNLERTLLGSTSEVRTIDWSPDGTELVSGDFNGTIKIWNSTSGNLDGSWDTQLSEVNSVSWSPDGSKILLGGGSFENIKIWNVTSHVADMSLTGHITPSGTVYGVDSVAWSSDGKQFATGSFDNNICIWNANTGEVQATLKGHTGVVKTITWSPDGKTLASGSFDTTIKLWDITTENLIKTLEDYFYDFVNTVIWSPDGTKIAGCSKDGTVQIFGNAPDVTCSPDDISFSSTNIIPNKEITITIIVRNVGLVAAKNCTMEIYCDNISIGSKIVDIPAENISFINISWTPPRTKGNHTIIVYLDSDGLLLEENEANNKALKTVNIGEPTKFTETLPLALISLVAITSFVVAIYIIRCKRMKKL